MSALITVFDQPTVHGMQQSNFDPYSDTNALCICRILQKQIHFVEEVRHHNFAEEGD